MSAEEIYNLLPAPPDGWESLPADFGACGGVLDHPETLPNGELPGSVEANLTVAINQAAEAARQAGKLPGGLESVLGDLNDPKVCWKHVLARFLRTNNSSDFSWQKPNRRFIADGLYLPSMYNPVIEEIAVVSDTSGSRTDEELNQDLAEISSIILDVNPNKVHFVEVDTEVQNYTEYTRESLPIKMSMTGRGGTCFSPGIEYINKHYPNVSALVYLTDLGSDDFGEQPSYPVLWITTDKGEVPYGEIIEI
jgi:predicted metal-dependent peptidase